MRSTRIVSATLIAIAAGLGTTAVTIARDGGGGTTKVRMRDAAGADVGMVRFVDDGGQTIVRVTLHLDPTGVATDAFHGFHVHANNDPLNGAGCVADAAQPATSWFVSADGHFKIEGQNHGAHLGDLVSLYVNGAGIVDGRFTTDRVDRRNLAGKAVIVHAAPDNFANVPTGLAPNQYTANGTDATTLTANTGNAGARIACGVIAP